mgnify:CR=1 FL=1|nr:MAG TPA: hypothetical protein [Caudoviricetes sp.]
MGFFNNWPFSNLHNLNLDWIVKEMKAIKEECARIWERVKPLPGGDPSTVTAAQAYGAATYARQAAEQAGQEADNASNRVAAHIDNKNNPHAVTAAQVGAEPAFTLLDVAKGGTGGYNPATARASLDARKDFTILPVSDGGTGSSTPAGARSAIGALGFSKNQTGDLNTGASDTSGWITYSVGGAEKCKLDLSTDGKLLVGQKTALVTGDAVPYTNHGNTLSADSWLDNNAFTFVVREGGNDACMISVYKAGGITANGQMIPTLGGRIQTGALWAGTAGAELTFPNAFTGDPFVTVSCSEMANVAVTNVTSTGCTITSSVDGNIVRWIAIQP